MNNNIIKVSRNTDNAPKNALSTQTVAFSHYNNISAQLPADPNTGELLATDIKAQAIQCLENVKAIVESINHVMDDVVKMTIFLKDIADIEAVDEVYASFFANLIPTRTVVAIAALPMNGALLQMDALISNGEGTAPQAACALVKVSRNTEQAPMCQLSTQTVAFSHYNNLSAQLPINPTTCELVAGGVKEQAEQCLTNIQTILQSIGHPMCDVVKTTIFLKNIADAEIVNAVFAQFYPNYMPAQTIVNACALPMGALLQIDAVVAHGDGTPPQLAEDSTLLVIESKNSENAPHATYAHTVAFSHYNHIAGQLPVNAITGEVVTGGIKAQAKQCLNNIKTIIESVDHVMDDTVKINIQLKNITDIDAVNTIYRTFFKGDLPARTVIGVTEIAMGALVQMDAVVSNCEGTPA